MDAAGQIFYSLGVGFGSLTLFSTGNTAKNNCYMDAIMCALGNCATSLWASIIMFSFFGFKAKRQVLKCELDRGAMFGGNSSIANATRTMSCDKREIFDQVFDKVSIYLLYAAQGAQTNCLTGLPVYAVLLRHTQCNNSLHNHLHQGLDKWTAMTQPSKKALLPKCMNIFTALCI